MRLRVTGKCPTHPDSKAGLFPPFQQDRPCYKPSPAVLVAADHRLWFGVGGHRKGPQKIRQPTLPYWNGELGSGATSIAPRAPLQTWRPQSTPRDKEMAPEPNLALPKR